MLKFYQDEWFGIKFSSFTTPSQRLPSSDFYEDFYDIFYKKYSSFEDLPDNYIQSKREISNFIENNFPEGKKILSIGCGNGIVENFLYSKGFDVSVIEPSKNALKFLEAKIPKSQINIGYFPKDFNNKNVFDIILINAIDYVFNNRDFHEFLVSINQSKNFSNNSCLILISASQYKPFSLFHFKEVVKRFLGKYNKWQLWGWYRSEKDYRVSLTQSGYKIITHGEISNTKFKYITATSKEAKEI